MKNLNSNVAGLFLLDLEKMVIKLKKELNQQKMKNQDLKEQNGKFKQENRNLTKEMAIFQ